MGKSHVVQDVQPNHPDSNQRMWSECHSVYVPAVLCCLSLLLFSSCLLEQLKTICDLLESQCVLSVWVEATQRLSAGRAEAFPPVTWFSGWLPFTEAQTWHFPKLDFLCSARISTLKWLPKPHRYLSHWSRKCPVADFSKF